MSDSAKRSPTEPIVAKSESAPDPFNPESLRISQDFVAAAGVKQVLATIPVRKPNRQDFVRVHPGEDYQLTTVIIELKDDRESYLVTPDLRDELTGEVIPVTLFLTVNRQSVVSFWPCKLPDPSGRVNAWHESATTFRVAPLRDPNGWK